MEEFARFSEQLTVIVVEGHALNNEGVQFTLELGLLQVVSRSVGSASDPALGNRHLTFGQGTSLIGADVGSTTHNFASAQVSHQVLIFEHLLDRIGQRDGYSERETLRHSYDDDSYGDNESSQNLHKGGRFPLRRKENVTGLALNLTKLDRHSVEAYRFSGAAQWSALVRVGPVVRVLGVASVVGDGVVTWSNSHWVDAVYNVVDQKDSEYQSGYNGTNLTDQNDL